MAEFSLQDHGLEILFRPDSCILAAARGEPLPKKVIFWYNFSLLRTRIFTIYKPDTVQCFTVGILLVSWRFFFSILFWSRKNILFFWDILACARGLVAWYQKPFSHRLTFKHTLKSYWNQRALEVRLKLSICVMLCWEGDMSLGRCLMLHITWTRQSNFMLAFWVYFNVHSPSMLNGLSTTVL